VSATTFNVFFHALFNRFASSFSWQATEITEKAFLGFWLGVLGALGG